jgi:hypothetical protein
MPTIPLRPAVMGFWFCFLDGFVCFLFSVPFLMFLLF